MSRAACDAQTLWIVCVVRIVLLFGQMVHTPFAVIHVFCAFTLVTNVLFACLTRAAQRCMHFTIGFLFAICARYFNGIVAKHFTAVVAHSHQPLNQHFPGDEQFSCCFGCKLFHLITSCSMAAAPTFSLSGCSFNHR